MTVPRGSTLTLLLVAASCALLSVGACTTGVTPVCDDAGTCLVSEPPDGGVVGEGSTQETGTGQEAAPEAGPDASPEAGPDADAAPESGLDASGG
jgi:hypothetical protein